MQQQITFRLPFDDQWLTFWGGNTAKLNQHHNETSQRFAFDFIQTNENGKFYRTDGKTNVDYYSFGQPILAPATGIIIEAVDGLRDNAPGVINHYQMLGNYVVIQHSENLFSVLAHLCQDSVMVKAGDEVKTGQKIGACGNSGYTTDPHLHYHVQDSATFARIGKNWDKQNVAKGVKVAFSNILVNDSNLPLSLHSPIKGELVSQL